LKSFKTCRKRNVEQTFSHRVLPLALYAQDTNDKREEDITVEDSISGRMDFKLLSTSDNESKPSWSMSHASNAAFIVPKNEVSFDRKAIPATNYGRKRRLTSQSPSCQMTRKT
jgi:hypothetical protein